MANDRARLLLHPVRMRVVIALSADELTARDLQRLYPDVAQASLYRALNQLLTGGVIEVVKESPKGGAVERTYRAVPEETQMTPEEFTSGDPTRMIASIQAFADMIVATASRAVAQAGPQWREERYSVRHDTLWLTSEERAELSEDLKAVYDKYTALDSSREGVARHALMVAALPEMAPFDQLTDDNCEDSATRTEPVDSDGDEDDAAS